MTHNMASAVLYKKYPIRTKAYFEHYICFVFKTIWILFSHDFINESHVKVLYCTKT